MNNLQATPASELQAKIEAKRYNYYTLPILDVTVKYRKPDLLKLSFNKQLPSFLADLVIKSYKEAIDGADMQAYQESLKKQKIGVDEELIKTLGPKGYALMSDLIVSHKVMDVPESDFSATPVPLISWVDIPEEDAIAFLFNLINTSQGTIETEGGEVTFEEVATFPSGEQVTERDISSKSRKPVRKVSE